MNIFLTIIIISLLVLLAVVAYNMRQETLYRNKIRSQFGHADQDALLNAAAQSVRDGKTFAADPEPVPLRRNHQTCGTAEPTRCRNKAARNTAVRSNSRTGNPPNLHCPHCRRQAA